MAKKIKLLLFGAGLVGIQVLPKYLQKFNVLAFADNDRSKHGTRLSGIEIVSAERICDFDYDFIVITSTASAQIFDQLLSMGILKEKIKEAHEIHGPKFPWDAVLFLVVLGLVFCFLLFYLIMLN